MSRSFPGLEASLLIKGNNGPFIISKCITLCVIVVVVVGAMRCWYCMHFVFTGKKGRRRKKKDVYILASCILIFILHFWCRQRVCFYITTWKRWVVFKTCPFWKTLGNFLPICSGKGGSRQQQSHQPAAHRVLQKEKQQQQLLFHASRNTVS